MGTSPPVAGWYRDPSRRFEHRYWNGTAWTTYVLSGGTRTTDPDVRPPDPARVTVTAPAQVPAAQAAAPGRPRWPVAIMVTVVGGAGLLALGSALPWAEAQSATASFSKNGIDGDGAITIVAAVLIVLASVVVSRPKRAAGLVVACAALAGAVALYDIVDTSRKAGELTDHAPATVSAGVGLGLWVALAGAVIALIGGIVAFALAPGSAEAGAR